MDIEWIECDNGRIDGECGAITIVNVVYCREGAAESSLVTFARLLAAASGVALPDYQPPPAGWYWTGTTTARGVWCPPVGPFESAQLATADASDPRNWTYAP
jgi:hypothetical protein